jgi:hypothetical protein
MQRAVQMQMHLGRGPNRGPFRWSGGAARIHNRCSGNAAALVLGYLPAQTVPHEHDRGGGKAAAPPPE